MKQLALIVTGDRHATGAWEPAIKQTFASAYGDSSVDHRMVLLHGDASGIDTLAARIASEWGWIVVPMPAQWDKYRKAAGPIRNAKMLDVLSALRDCGYETRVLAFHDNIAESKGTKDCVRAAGIHAFPVTVYGSDSKERPV